MTENPIPGADKAPPAASDENAPPVAELAAAEGAALAAIAGAATADALERLKPEVLGRKSPIKLMLQRLGKLPAEARPAFGQAVNEAQARVEAVLETRLADARAAELAERLREERVDVTLPAPPAGPRGALHPLTRVQRDIEVIFTGMGYAIADGPEIETEYHNFDALNIKADHPARDMHDTFYVDVPGLLAKAAGGVAIDSGVGVGDSVGGDLILRTHTSPVQIRHMLAHRPPVAVIAPGRVYRVDDIDATHSPVFHQVEGLLVDEGVSFAHLKGTVGVFLRAMFGAGLATRFRPSYFPFTEPSAEIDVECFVCGGKDAACRVCKGTAWVELGGCGMVHPAVLEAVGLDPAVYSGFAFGFGLDRFTMLRHDLPSIRALYENDVRFLGQFRE